MNFSKIVAVYEALDNTTKRSQKTAIVARLFHESAQDIDKVILLLQGNVFSSNNKTQLGVASSYAVKALSIASGLSKDEITLIWKETGDLGLTAERVMSQKKQSTLFMHDELTVDKVFSHLQKIATLEGSNSVDYKVKLIADLFSSSQGVEAKYAMRLVLETLRVGVGSGIIRDALVWAFLPAINYIFEYDVTQKVYIPTALGFERIDAHEYVSLETVLDESIQSMTTDDSKEALLSNADIILASTEQHARVIYTFFTETVQHAIDVTNDILFVAQSLVSHKQNDLLEVIPRLGTPIASMLAKKAVDVADAVLMVSLPCFVEYKYDGFRVQAHVDVLNKKVSLFTRRFENVTHQFPDVVSLLNENITQSCILDCELVGFDVQKKSYLPFQYISQRIRRKYEVERLISELPVELNVFDILLFENKNCIDMPLIERRQIIEQIIPKIPWKIRPSECLQAIHADDINKFYQRSLSAGNEGVMCKKLDSPYKPGSRVGYMVKLKPVMETLDLVVTGATWGEGKRANWLTSFTLSCRDEDNFLEIGKVGTGFKEIEGDELTFSHMTELLNPLIITEKGRDVIVKPKIVLEVSFEEIQKSSSYGSGFALRFPRVVRLRTGRDETNASELEYVIDLYDQQ